MTRTGRRAGNLDTRVAILAVARRRFGARGYDATSLRSIAAEAHVDPALLIHYFSTKEGLFAAVIGLGQPPSELLGDLASLPLREAAERVVRVYLEMVDSDESRNAILSLVRSAVSNEKQPARFENLSREFLVVLTSLCDEPDAGLRGVARRVATHRHRDAPSRHPRRTTRTCAEGRDRRSGRAENRVVSRTGRLGFLSARMARHDAACGFMVLSRSDVIPAT